jgi:hypothetical protein
VKVRLLLHDPLILILSSACYEFGEGAKRSCSLLSPQDERVCILLIINCLLTY